MHVRYAESDKERYRIDVSGKHVLTMTSDDGRSWTDRIGGKPSDEARRIVVQVPDALMGNLSLSTTNEDVSLPAMSVRGSVTVSCNHGDIAFGPLQVGRAISLDVKNGDVSGTVAGGSDEFTIHSTVKKGRSNLPSEMRGGDKTLDVSANNGDIDVEFVK